MDKPINLYNDNIKERLLDLALSASKVPDRFNPLPDGFNVNMIKSDNFMNYLQISLRNVTITEDIIENLTSYMFNYEGEEWNEFTYLFHGSPYHNWHSILRNGLKNYSGTDKMTTGAVHGKGIYLSNDLCMSAGYSRSTYNGKYIIGVFEVAKPPDAPEVKTVLSDADPVRKYYKKTESIFVVPNEDCVRLKYLVVMSGVEELSKFGDNLIKFFRERLYFIKNSQARMSVLSLKRLEKEKSRLLKLIPELLIDDNWRCKYFELEFQIVFSVNYPILPPEITIISHITHPNIINNTLCMDALYDWKINYCLDMVVLTMIVQLKDCKFTDHNKYNHNWKEIHRSLKLLKYI
jgi:hypothetical protein